MGSVKQEINSSGTKIPACKLSAAQRNVSTQLCSNIKLGALSVASRIEDPKSEQRSCKIFYKIKNPIKERKMANIINRRKTTTLRDVSTVLKTDEFNYSSASSLEKSKPMIKLETDSTIAKTIKKPSPSNSFTELVKTAAIHQASVKKKLSIKPAVRLTSSSLYPPLPYSPTNISNLQWKPVPSRPILNVRRLNLDSQIVLTWSLENLSSIQEAVEIYEIYAYKETSLKLDSEMWRHVADVRSVQLPMAVTIKLMNKDERYYFIVRGADVHMRNSHFSVPKTWQ